MAATAVRSKRAVLVTTSLVSSLIMLDSNIVAVSLPAMARALHASFADVEWVINAYLLSYTGLLLATGAIADKHGRKRTMLVGLCVFGVASAGCGFATSASMLNVARAVQGVGASMLVTASLAIIAHTFQGTERAHAFAVWGAALGIALTAGPILGGAITNLVGWRWVFFVNVPVSVGLAIATARVISESTDEGARGLDVAGIVTFSPGLFLLVWGLTDGNDAGWGSLSVLARLGGAAVFFGVFAVAELRQARPMVDFGLFRTPTFLGSVIAMFGYGASAQVMIFYLPIFLQNVFRFSPGAAGLGMIPFALPMVLAPKLTPAMASRVSGRITLSVGLAITTLGDLFFAATASAGVSYPVFAVAMLVAGAGAGVLNGETVKVLSGAVPPERAGMASGIASTVRFVGILVGVAGLGAVLAPSAKAGLFAQGFALASLAASAMAGVAGALTFRYVGSTDTTAPAAYPCQAIDCRHPI